ncbi:gliding motility protein GldN [Paraprevotella clara]|jgi:gliding motility associated protien GldN|uniref:type IX secretion system ring protein PorN/GldN n=2 Tax=Paraprevotella TaxID=577309 RepID=UPI003C6E9866
MEMKTMSKNKIRMKRLFFVLLGVALYVQAEAQPARRRVKPNDADKAEKTVDRASLQFPVAVEVPEDVVWRRDVYRQLDLTLDKNAPLYYPVEPSAGQINLFTYLFDLLLTGKITAYQYKLDGNESFTSRDKVDVKELLERYHIYYEEQNGRPRVNASDIPSAEVSRYYIKESSYFDQRTSTFRTKVTALCPVLMRGDDFGGEATPYPLFWLKYDDISTYLARHTMMASNYNNVTNMTAADYFSMNLYDGKIYKTNNMQGKVLANYCKTDSAMANEQKRIEKQLSDFEKHVWGHDDSVAVDSTVAKEAVETKKEKASRTTRNSRRASASSDDSKKAKAEKTKVSKTRRGSSGGGGASTPRVTVRRQRR